MRRAIPYPVMVFTQCGDKRLAGTLGVIAYLPFGVIFDSSFAGKSFS